jgi:hypothetical protein
MLLLDTHVLIWLDEGNPRLGENALQTIIESLSAGQLAVGDYQFFGNCYADQKATIDRADRT